MRLPNGERADLGTKLEAYVLDAGHPEGRHKARRFESTLGITAGNAEVLRRASLGAAARSDAAEMRGDNGFGDVYVLRFALTTQRGTATLQSVWVVLHAEDFPRLTTCYIVSS